MPKPKIDHSKLQRRYAWTVIDDDGNEIHHFKTIDEHGATVGEHTEGFVGRHGLTRHCQVLHGVALTQASPIEEIYGSLPLSIDCQEGRERRQLRIS